MVVSSSFNADNQIVTKISSYSVLLNLSQWVYTFVEYILTDTVSFYTPSKNFLWV